MSHLIDAKALTLTANKLREAVDQTRFAYLFCPGSYTMSAFEACLAAADAFDRYVSELAFAHSAEWLRKFPKIISEPDHVE
jgi:hypothetical protein